MQTAAEPARAVVAPPASAIKTQAEPFGGCLVDLGRGAVVLAPPTEEMARALEVLAHQRPGAMVILPDFDGRACAKQRQHECPGSCRGEEHCARLLTPTMSDDDFLRQAVRCARNRRRGPTCSRWVAVMDAFACGSTYAHGLCVRFGLNPDEQVRR